MVPVSSPTRHSAIRVCRRCWDTDRPFCNTVLELTTLTMSVWPLVPGLSCSILTKTGFLRPGLAAALVCCSSCDAGVGDFPVAIDAKAESESVKMDRKLSSFSMDLGLCVWRCELWEFRRVAFIYIAIASLHFILCSFFLFGFFFFVTFF